MRPLLDALTRNAWSRFGSALTTASALVFLALLALDLGGRVHGPYHGMVAYLLIPALFVLGLLLIPIGILLDRRRARRTGADTALPVVDLNVRRTRALVLGFLGLTGINVALLGIATYRGAEAMETTRFCGTTCHNIMTPEYTTHAASVHSGVRCVHCHIGPGGTFYVRAKLNGAKQAIEAILDRYPRPIPAPVHILRPAHEICTECHEAAKDKGEVRRVIRHRGDDEKNTAQETVFLMHVGGRSGDRTAGIHWHADPATKIRYHSDAARTVIDTVELTAPDGTVTTYRAKAAPASGPASAEGDSQPAGEGGSGAEAGGWRAMDCIDCHNRVAHPAPPPEAVVDRAIDAGSIDAALPYVRRESVRLLKGTQGSADDARRALATGLRAFYEKNHPEIAATQGGAIDAAGRTLGDLYASNVFADMKVTWGTYADHLGHDAWPGCIRCHDDEHKADDGRVISQDCEKCHTEVTPS